MTLRADGEHGTALPRGRRAAQSRLRRAIDASIRRHRAASRLWSSAPPSILRISRFRSTCGKATGIVMPKNRAFLPQRNVLQRYSSVRSISATRSATGPNAGSRVFLCILRCAGVSSNCMLPRLAHANTQYGSGFVGVARRAEGECWPTTSAGTAAPDWTCTDDKEGKVDGLHDHSHWGHADQLGAGNLLTIERRLSALRSIHEGRVYDLSHEISPAAPFMAPNQTPFLMSIWASWRDSINRPRGIGATNDAGSNVERAEMTMHVGTHIDALGHFSIGEHLYNGLSAAEVVTDWGLERLGMEHQPTVSSC